MHCAAPYRRSPVVWITNRLRHLRVRENHNDMSKSLLEQLPNIVAAGKREAGSSAVELFDFVRLRPSHTTTRQRLL